VRPVRWFRRLDRRGRLLVAAGHLIVAVGLAALVWWWDTYWAQYVAENILPPSGETLIAIYIVHLKLHVKLDAQEQRAGERHDDMKQHVTATATKEPG